MCRAATGLIAQCLGEVPFSRRPITHTKSGLAAFQRTRPQNC
jgi:hypothetical protein